MDWIFFANMASLECVFVQMPAPANKPRPQFCMSIRKVDIRMHA